VTSPDIHTLTGAYAADALPADERRAFEEHLAVCEPCAQEVAELQATAARLAEAAAEPPPPGLKQAVLAEIDRIRQEPPDTGDQLARRRRTTGWWPRIATVAAAVATIGVIGLGVLVVDQRAQLAEVDIGSDRVVEVLAAADAQVVVVDGPDGSEARVIVSANRGEAVFVVSGMAPAPHAHTYELWMIGADGPVPAGLFDVDERGHATNVMTGDLDATLAIGVTVEPEGGSPQPTTDPIMVVDLDG
jgi:anti-sigma-K factor RskA